ncbi:MAG: NosD domain-containing protein [Candidatus Bathyarchaeia archaeon]
MRRSLLSMAILTLLVLNIFARPLMIPTASSFDEATIYILADGSVVPDTAPIHREGDIYYLTGDVFSHEKYGIMIEKSHMILDGDGHKVFGNWTGTGIQLNHVENVTVKNVQVAQFSVGVMFENSMLSGIINSRIGPNGAFGILIDDSSNSNFVNQNEMVENSKTGVFLSGSGYSKIQYNHITGGWFGIQLHFSNGNDVYRNSITGSEIDGLHMLLSFNNNITENSFTNNFVGLTLNYSAANTVAGNYFYDNYRGISLHTSSYNLIYHNKFENSVNVYDYSWNNPSIDPSINIWDDGYPSGGNYWSNYSGMDLYHGSYQNMTGSDGIGDTPYVIDPNNVDRYPLFTMPWTHFWPMYVNAQVGTTFSVDIYASNVFNLWAWKLYLLWNNEILEYVNCTFGNFSNLVNNNVIHFSDSIDSSCIVFMESALSASANPVSASNLRLITVNFKILKAGSSYLLLMYPELRGQDQNSEAAYPGCGDANGDGVIDTFDVWITWSYVKNERYASIVDFNGDMKVDLSDMAIVTSNYGKYYGGPGWGLTKTIYEIPTLGQLSWCNVTGTPPVSEKYDLSVTVVNSFNGAVGGALVTAGNVSGYTDSFGKVMLSLPPGTYDVHATHPSYKPTVWTVDLDRPKSITLTLELPYDFEELPDENIIVEPVDGGYNITLFNILASSAVNVFFDWDYVGTIQANEWMSFNYSQMPTLVIIATWNASADYPKAWFKYLLPVELKPTTGEEGALPKEDVPYVAASIFVNPYPPIYGQNTTIGVVLQNPYDHSLHISRIDFQISGLTIAGEFKSVGYLSNITLQPHEENIFTIVWLANVSGHHCVKVVLTYSPYIQTAQRNIDIENDMNSGDIGEMTFNITNPYESARLITIILEEHIPPGWNVDLEINGRRLVTSPFEIVVPGGGDLQAMLKIISSSNEPGAAVVDIKAYIGEKLIGGIRKIMVSKPVSETSEVLSFIISQGNSLYNIQLWVPKSSYDQALESINDIARQYPGLDRATLGKTYYLHRHLASPNAFPVTQIRVYRLSDGSPVTEISLKTALLSGLLLYCQELYAFASLSSLNSFKTLGDQWHQTYQQSTPIVFISDTLAATARLLTIIVPIIEDIEDIYGELTSEQVKGSVALIFDIFSGYDSLKEQYGEENANKIVSILKDYGLVTSANYNGIKVLTVTKADPSKLAGAVSKIRDEVFGDPLTSDAGDIISEFISELVEGAVSEFSASAVLGLYAYFGVELTAHTAIEIGVSAALTGFLESVIPYALAGAIYSSYIAPMAEAIHSAWVDMGLEAQIYYKMQEWGAKVASPRNGILNLDDAKVFAGVYGIQGLVEYHYYECVYYYKSHQAFVSQSELNGYKNSAFLALDRAEDWADILEQIDGYAAAIVNSFDPEGLTLNYVLSPPVNPLPAIPENAFCIALIARSTFDLNLTCGRYVFTVQNRTWDSNFPCPFYFDDAYGSSFLLIFNPPKGEYIVRVPVQTEIALVTVQLSEGEVHVETVLNVTADTLHFNMPLATVESCNAEGEAKDIFYVSENVYIVGRGFAPNTRYEVYIVKKTVWIDGMPIPQRVNGTLTYVISDENGNIAVSLVWAKLLTVGKYDIVIDVNHNGLYDEGVDALDSGGIEAKGGFFVIPEYWLGTITGLSSFLSALASYYLLKFRLKLRRRFKKAY